MNNILRYSLIRLKEQRCGIDVLTIQVSQSRIEIILMSMLRILLRKNKQERIN